MKLKQFFLGVVPNYPQSARFDDAKTVTIECSAKEAIKAADDYERKLNGGHTYAEEFAIARTSLENFDAFSRREWYKVHCQTWAQARDYIRFADWMNLPISTLPISTLPV